LFMGSWVFKGMVKPTETYASSWRLMMPSFTALC